ncbi:ATP-dependent DNA helicase pif1 [Eumeta japonica]|uniref:ATP-dependent DNA helicase n=1 Tax=Eumeta variegata TaxID=151549 RepID=A0A4C1UEZ6_EUMVA|nr:ATP-dependent DNA helicase pif1 [Eumeta japonica]
MRVDSFFLHSIIKDQADKYENESFDSTPAPVETPPRPAPLKTLKFRSSRLVGKAQVSPTPPGKLSPNRPQQQSSTAMFNMNTILISSLATFVADSHQQQSLTDEQRNIYNKINVSIATRQHGFFFLDAPGGTAKTFLILLTLARIRSQNHISLEIASSGIAATTLLDGRRTAHSALKFPLNIHTNPSAMCNLKKHSGTPDVLRKCKIIIWSECTMVHQYSLEALDRFLKDVKNNTRLFGGALLLVSGDFRQTLSVIPCAT